MSLAEWMIERIEGVGGALTVNGEHIHCQVPEDAAYLIDELRAHKDEVLVLLNKRSAIRLVECRAPHCAGCYDVGDGKKIHPPKCGQEYLEWLKRWKPKGMVQ